MHVLLHWSNSLLLLIYSLNVAYGSDQLFNNVWELLPGQIRSLKSISYPDHSPGNVTTTWNVLAPSNFVIQLTCLDLHIPALSDNNCGGRLFVFSLSDGEISRDLCGDHNNMKYRSKTNQLFIFNRVDVDGGALINCTVKAVPKKFRTTLPLLHKRTYEVDSSEHGGPQGRKTTTCKCGWANKANLRVIGGGESDVNEYPFLVGLTRKFFPKPFCGGSIITPLHVLTSAHCVVNMPVNNLEVLIGDHNWGKANETINSSYKVVVSKKDLHPVYLNYEKPSADIAVLTLSKRVDFNKFVGPVCLPNRELKLEGEYVKVIGWGRTTSKGESSLYVKEVDVKVEPIETCYRSFRKHVNLNKPQLVCTFAEKKGIGLGDSGGPVVWLDPETNRYTLVGLPALVYVYDEGDHRHPDMSTDVSTYLDWIHEKIRESQPEATCRKED